MYVVPVVRERCGWKIADPITLPIHCK